MKYIGVVVEKYSYMIEVEANSWDEASEALEQINTKMLKPYHVDTEILKVGDA
jgi:hypothetical protein